MAAAKKKPAHTRWHTGEIPFEDLDESEQVAHTIVQQFGDLAPSVDRIMNADLTDSERHVAISSFQTSLGDLDDPNRDPRNAIAGARGAG